MSMSPTPVPHLLNPPLSLSRSSLRLVPAFCVAPVDVQVNEERCLEGMLHVGDHLRESFVGVLLRAFQNHFIVNLREGERDRACE